MTENNIAVTNQNDANEVEIDLVQAVKMILRHIRAIILWTVLCALLGAVITCVTPTEYAASTIFYIEYVNVSTGTTAGSPYTTETRNISAASSFVDTFRALLFHDETLGHVLEKEGLETTTEELDGLQKMITCSTSGGQMIRVDVTADAEQTAVSIAQTIADIMPDKLMAQVDGVNISVVEAGKLLPDTKSPLSIIKNGMIGAVAGLVVSCGVFFLLFVLDRHIFAADYLAKAYPGVPLLTALPDEKHAKEGGALEEAYKLLRTYLMPPGGEAGQMRVIGVTSALAGEGKTETASELARVLAQAGKKVLLLEGDMRHPCLAGTLGLQSGPDFAELLAKDDAAAAVQTCSQGLDAAVCRTAPGEPSELISSAQMFRFVEQARGRYDYVLIDLPAVMEAADAVAVSRMADGMLVVVRAGRADMDSLAETMRRLAVADGRVLGFVFNGREQAKKKH